ncbi:MAG TPA: hypothetical protein VKZ98_08100 [Aquaticitalea sp.]|nr:hypothetical protein [Aquaticitalea sp.]
MLEIYLDQRMNSVYADMFNDNSSVSYKASKEPFGMGLQEIKVCAFKFRGGDGIPDRMHCIG